MQNSRRILISCLRQAAANLGASFHTLCDDWIVRLQHQGHTHHIVGYDFPLNTCTAQMLAKDKCATYAVLSHASVPALPHTLAHHPKMSAYVPMEGNWPWLTALLQKHGQLVLKPNEGTGGSEVHRVSTPAQLENALHLLHTKTRAVAVSPYINIAHECRAVVLDDAVLLVYEKIRPTVTGDGTRTLLQLLLSGSSTLSPTSLKSFPLDDPSLSHVPPSGQVCPVNWRHNLGQGAAPLLIAKDSPHFAQISTLALSAARALGLRFCSVDVIQQKNDPTAPTNFSPLSWQVLEINAGVMMENLARTLPNGHSLATNIYQQAISKILHSSTQ